MSHHPIQFQLKHKRIYEGHLLKRSKYLRQWRDRWVVLTQHYLVTFVTSTSPEITDIVDVTTIKSVKSYLNFQEEMTPSAFKLRTIDSQFYFAARDLPEKWSWIVALERLLHYHRAQMGKKDINPLQFTRSQGFPSLQVFTATQQSIQRKANERDQEEALKIVTEQLEQMNEKYKILTQRYQKLQKVNDELNSDKQYFEYLQREKESKGVSFRQNRAQKQQESLQAKRRILESLLHRCGQQAINQSDFPVIASFISEIVSMEDTSYRQLWVEELGSSNNKHFFIESFLSLFQLQAHSKDPKKLQILHLMLQRKSSLFTYQQINQLSLQIISLKSYKVKERLRVIETLDSVNPIEMQQVVDWLRLVEQTNDDQLVKSTISRILEKT